MSLIQVDKGKCKRDGICAAVCPGELIRFDGENFPVEEAGAERGCIACGHCVAACPTEALSNARVTGCLPFDDDLKMDARSLEQFPQDAAYGPGIQSCPGPTRDIGAGNRYGKVGAVGRQLPAGPLAGREDPRQ